MKKTVVVIDGGGRGAALVAKYSQSKNVEKIIAIPGNDLMQINSRVPVETHTNLKTTSVEEILEICKKEKADFVDVAQDNAIAVGLVDRLTKEGFPTFGAGQKPGELEWNKAFAREFMKRHEILQPEYFIFHSQKDGVLFLSREKDQPWFVKASGLAEGKGALPAKNNKEAIEAIKQMGKFGTAGETYLLEKWLRTKKGYAEEFSAFFICDGKNFKFLGCAQDHKRALNFDEGENTGGMGCVSNPQVVTKDIYKQVVTIAKKTIDGMKKEGKPYIGILYIGCMIVDKKVYVIEYNSRWGDPEVEVVLPSVENDLLELGMSSINGKINKKKIKIDKKIRVAVACTAKGYPQDYSLIKGKEIFGIEKVIKMNGIILGAGIKISNKKFFVNGGRILYVIGEGKNILEAREKAYSAVSKLFIEGNSLHYRTDIGWRDVERFYKKS